MTFSVVPKSRTFITDVTSFLCVKMHFFVKIMRFISSEMAPILLFWMKVNWIKSVSREYSYDEEYLEEFNKRKISKYFLTPAVLPRYRLDPKSFGILYKLTLQKIIMNFITSHFFQLTFFQIWLCLTKFSYI